MRGEPTNLVQRAVKAAAWGYVGTAARLVIQVGAQVVLARLLGPAEYGLFAIAVVSVSLTIFASDIASSALIHAPQLNDDLIRFASTVQILAGLTLTVMLALLAQPLSVWLKQPDVAQVILFSSPICMVGALGGVALALLRRRLDYGIIQVWQTAGYFVGYVLVGIPLAAYSDAGVWALVAAWGVQSTIATLGFLWHAPHRWRPLLNCPDAKPLLKFGSKAMLANFSNWALSNVDRLIVARTAPIREMGLYSTMINLLSSPLAQILGTYQSVAFSATARSTDDSARKTFIVMLGGGSLIVCMLYGVVLAIPDTLIQVLYGSKWSDATPYMIALSLGFIAYGMQATITPLLWGRGAVEREAIPQFVMAIMLGVAAWVASSYSTLAVAWAFTAVNIVRCAWILIACIRLFRISPADVVFLLMRSILPAGALAIVLLTSDQVGRIFTTSPAAWAAGDFIAMAIATLLLYSNRRRWMNGQLLASLSLLSRSVQRNTPVS